MNLHTLHRQPITLSEELGRGGEARILKVTDQPNLVAKIYHQPTDMHEAKLKAMLARPPRQSQEQLTVMWPLDLLYQQGQFVGFLMPNLHSMGECDTIFKFYNPAKRATLYPNFTWRYLHRTALNLMIAAKGIHAAGHIIGDINESNILVTPQALIRWVDTDSFQVMGANGQVYRCPVGKPEYTPPELQGVDFKQVNQTVAHDYFGLGVLLFQLLMEGYHPFTGSLLFNESVGRVDLFCIREGIFPYLPNTQVAPPLNAPQLESLHPALQTAFKQCFVEGHHDPAQRPTPRQWITALEEAEAHLITCTKNPTHVYADHVGFCSWCEAELLPQKALEPIISPLQPDDDEPIIWLQPNTITFEPTTAGLYMIYRHDFGGYVAAMTLIFALILAVIGSWLGNYWFLLQCFPLPMMFLFMIYMAIETSLNKTRIILTSDLFSVKRGPLPHFDTGNFQINTGDIYQIYTKTTQPSDFDDKNNKYKLYVFARDKINHLVWANNTQSTVQFVEQQLKRQLNLPEMPLQQDYLASTTTQAKSVDLSPLQPELTTCPHGHTYDSHLDSCPRCVSLEKPSPPPLPTRQGGFLEVMGLSFTSLLISNLLGSMSLILVENYSDMSMVSLCLLAVATSPLIAVTVTTILGQRVGRIVKSNGGVVGFLVGLVSYLTFGLCSLINFLKIITLLV